MEAERPGANRYATIRARITATACIVVTLGLVFASLLLLVLLRRALENNVEGAARARAHDIAALVRDSDVLAVLPVPGGKEAMVQVIDRRGKVLAASANLETNQAISGLRPTFGRTRSRTYNNLPIKDEANDSFRVLALGVQGRHGPLTVFVAISLEQVEESVATVRYLLLIGVPFLVALAGVTTWRVVGRALRPVDAICRQVAYITERDLSRRVPELPTDDEIGRLARAMNQMLDRLEGFSTRQHKFVADASHELQSPLASSLADLESSLAQPSATDWPETATGLMIDNQRMSRLVQDLLFLATADHSVGAAPRVLVDLDDLVRSQAARIRSGDGVRVDCSRIQPVEARVSMEEFARVVRNLLENGIRFAHTRVTVSLHAENEMAVLAFEDDGPGVPAAERETIFERFARLDNSRSRATGGTGLGLAIARQIVERHGGTIEVGGAPGGGARFVVRIPRDTAM